MQRTSNRAAARELRCFAILSLLALGPMACSGTDASVSSGGDGDNGADAGSTNGGGGGPSGGAGQSGGATSTGDSGASGTTGESTWGYLGCSNTHDTIEGYHAAPGSKHRFWPFAPPGFDYRIEGHTVFVWSDPNDPVWPLFDRMKATYNGGADPKVLWIQLCENLDPAMPTYHVTTDKDFAAMMTNVKAHAPTSTIYISPLQAYGPDNLCPYMGTTGEAIPALTDFAGAAVDHGLAQPGPGTKGLQNLGPLTSSLVHTDNCHPSGPAHSEPMAGSGELFLGTQLAQVFDAMP